MTERIFIASYFMICWLNFTLIWSCEESTLFVTLFLTLFILIDYPIHIDTISMELSILYLKGFYK